jgi:hypothetical protein
MNCHFILVGKLGEICRGFTGADGASFGKKHIFLLVLRPFLELTRGIYLKGHCPPMVSNQHVSRIRDIVFEICVFAKEIVDHASANDSRLENTTTQHNIHFMTFKIN